MIASMKIVGINFDVDEATRKYAHKRIGRLDKYMPRHARATAYANIRLAQVNHDHGNKFQAEVRLDLPGKSINVKDSTVNIFAAIDIVEAKLKSQIDDYKQSHVDHIGKRRLMSRFKQSFQREL